MTLIARLTTLVLLLSGPSWAQETTEITSPQRVYEKLRELRAEIEDAHRRRVGGKYPTHSELLNMDQETADATVLEASKKRKELIQIQDEANAKADDLVTTLIAQLLTQGTLDQAVSRYPSNDMLAWMVDTSTDSEHAFFTASIQAFSVEPQRTMYILELFRASSTPLAEGIGSAFLISAYLIRKTSEEVVLHQVLGEGINSRFGANALYGATPTEDSPWPFVVLIGGPEGTAHAARVSRLDIDEELDMVRYALVADTSGFRDFRFDPETGAVYYPVSEGAGDENNERAFRAGEVEPGPPLEYTKGIHFPIPGAAKKSVALAEAGPAENATPQGPPSEPEFPVQLAGNQITDASSAAGTDEPVLPASDSGAPEESGTRAPALPADTAEAPPQGGASSRWVLGVIGLVSLGVTVFVVRRRAA